MMWVFGCVCLGVCLCVHFRFGACHGDVVTNVRGVHFAVASVVLCSLKCKNKYHTHGSFHRSLSHFLSLSRLTFSCFWAQVYITLGLLTAAAVCVWIDGDVCVCVGAQLSTADWILLCCDFATLWRLLAHFARPLTSRPRHSVTPLPRQLPTPHGPPESPHRIHPAVHPLAANI